MIERSFTLRPFPSADPPPPLKISGRISRDAGTFAVSYGCSGRLDRLTLPPPAERPVRKDGLWKETCFEFFLAEKGSSRYLEFNLSPSGHWNVYRFADYRREMEEQEMPAGLPFRVERRAESLTLTLEVDLGGILRADRPVEAAISAVLRRDDGAVTFWALTHCGPVPDFHLRESFLMGL